MTVLTVYIYIYNTRTRVNVRRLSRAHPVSTIGRVKVSGPRGMENVFRNKINDYTASRPYGTVVIIYDARGSSILRKSADRAARLIDKRCARRNSDRHVRHVKYRPRLYMYVYRSIVVSTSSTGGFPARHKSRTWSSGWLGARAGLGGGELQRARSRHHRPYKIQWIPARLGIAQYARARVYFYYNTYVPPLIFRRIIYNTFGRDVFLILFVVVFFLFGDLARGRVL